MVFYVVDSGHILSLRFILSVMNTCSSLFIYIMWLHTSINHYDHHQCIQHWPLINILWYIKFYYVFNVLWLYTMYCLQCIGIGSCHGSGTSCCTYSSVNHTSWPALWYRLRRLQNKYTYIRHKHIKWYHTLVNRKCRNDATMVQPRERNLQLHQHMPMLFSPPCLTLLSVPYVPHILYCMAFNLGSPKLHIVLVIK